MDFHRVAPTMRERHHPRPRSETFRRPASGRRVVRIDDPDPGGAENAVRDVGANQRRTPTLAPRSRRIPHSAPLWSNSSTLSDNSPRVQLSPQSHLAAALTSIRIDARTDSGKPDHASMIWIMSGWIGPGDGGQMVANGRDELTQVLVAELVVLFRFRTSNPMQCFNGAATRVSRKSLDSLHLPLDLGHASMGPRRGCRGRGRFASSFARAS